MNLVISIVMVAEGYRKLPCDSENDFDSTSILMFSGVKKHRRFFIFSASHSLNA